MRVWDGYVHTAIFKTDSQQGLTVKKLNFKKESKSFLTKTEVRNVSQKMQLRSN